MTARRTAGRRRRTGVGVLGLALTLALTTATVVGQRAATGVAVRLPTIACPTSFGIDGMGPPRPIVPTTTMVVVPRSTAGALALYVQSAGHARPGLRVLGPRGWLCSGIVYADGGANLRIFPATERRAGEGYAALKLGVTLGTDEACQGCIEFAACPYFRAACNLDPVGPPTGLIPGESTYVLTRTAVAFEIPPSPSRGPYPDNGVVLFARWTTIIQGHRRPTDGDYSAACILPPRAHAECTAILNAVVARYDRF